MPFEMKAESVDALEKAIKEYGPKAEKVINDVYHNEAGDIIIEGIMPLLPVSGRTWKGKKKAASETEPFQIETKENLAVTVKSKKAYQYLVFPDDGSNTRNHAGNQHFMRRGGEAKADEIVNRCLGALEKEF